MSRSPVSAPPSWLKPTVDYGPLAVFFLAYEIKGLLFATAALMAATVAALILSWVVARKVALVALITAIVVGVFGGLTLWLKDDTFIKMKPTIIYGLFAAVLAGGVLMGKPFLKSLLGEALSLDDDGWRKLTVRFIGFFLLMGAANEVIRRVLSTEQWVLWKVGGSIVATFAFMLLQTPLLRRHHQDAAKPEGEQIATSPAGDA